MYGKVVRNENGVVSVVPLPEELELIVPVTEVDGNTCHAVQSGVCHNLHLASHTMQVG